jgi:small subunit ribosomal protein S17
MANETATKAAGRAQRRTLIGVVTRDKMNKTRRVDVERLVRHPRYGKYVKKRTVCYVHDETNESHVGDTVEIMETRPLSKQKCWRLLRVITKAPIKVQIAETPTA